MIAIETKKVEKLIRKYQVRIDDYNQRTINRLKRIKYNYEKFHLERKEVKYLEKLISEISFLNIITIKPEEIKELINKLKIVPKKNRLRSIVFKNYKPLKDHILGALEYQKRRSDFYPEYFQKLGIKSCVYCNSQHTVSVETTNNKKEKTVEAKFQVDHFYPQSKYPYLSISLFNLFPTCDTCNRLKSNNSVPFYLYSCDEKDIQYSKYKFKLSLGAVAKYLTNFEINDIKFKFIDPYKANNVEHSLQDTFDIQGIYETQKDVIEELILKSQIYTQTYKDTLKLSFPKLLNNASLSNRILIGNYTDPKDIHKRPMSKFTQDIAADLGLLDHKK